MGAVNHTKATRARVLKSFSYCGRIDKACADNGVSRKCHYIWLKIDPGYAKAFAVARERIVDALEGVAHDRALNGTKRKVTVAGRAAIIREYDNGLLQFLLMAHKPEMYNPKKRVELEGSKDQPLRLIVRSVLDPMPE